MKIWEEDSKVSERTLPEMFCESFWERRLFILGKRKLLWRLPFQYKLINWKWPLTLTLDEVIYLEKIFQSVQGLHCLYFSVLPQRQPEGSARTWTSKNYKSGKMVIFLDVQAALLFSIRFFFSQKYWLQVN